MAHEKFDVGGMTCAACQAHVEKAVAGVDGEFELEPGQVVHLNDELDTFTSDEAVPGATIPVALSFQGTITRDAPVLDGTIPPYDEYLP